MSNLRWLLRRRHASAKAQGGRGQGKGQAQGFAAECGKGFEDRGVLGADGKMNLARAGTEEMQCSVCMLHSVER